MLVEVYRGWKIYFSPNPRPLWTASKGIEKDIYSYESLKAIQGYIDRKIMKDALEVKNGYRV